MFEQWNERQAEKRDLTPTVLFDAKSFEAMYPSTDCTPTRIPQHPIQGDTQ